MTIRTTKPAINLREELASLRNQGGYSEQQFWMDGLVTNGTFGAATDWTLDTGWSIAGGVLSKASGSGNSRTATQAVNFVAGRRYIAEFEYTDQGSDIVFGYGTFDSIFSILPSSADQNNFSGTLFSSKPTLIFISELCFTAIPYTFCVYPL